MTYYISFLDMHGAVSESISLVLEGFQIALVLRSIEIQMDPDSCVGRLTVL